MNEQAQAFLTRMQAACDKVIDMSRLSEWIVRNTTAPKDRSIPWSFKGHEYQKDILNDHHGSQSVRKCSQVGVSELSVRLVLAFLSVYSGYTAIYTLQTTSFARRFSKARFDSVVAGSKVLRASIPSDTDSSELKQVGSSFLYIAGSYGQNAAISVPADIVVNDEVDFSNQKALSTFTSRLGHAAEVDEFGSKGFRRRFSTPTVSGFGISKTFEVSTRGRYSARCDRCEQIVIPDIFNDVVIPGYDDKIISLEKEDLLNLSYQFDKAYLKCPSCSRPIRASALEDPSRREWVHEFPELAESGFQVMPFDVPAVNPLTKTLTAIADYATKADWVNFEMGLPYEDAETSFMQATIKANTTLQWVKPREMAAHGCVAGMDVGKTSWLLIGKPNGKGTDGNGVDVIHAEQIRQDGEGKLVKTVLKRLKEFGVVKMVVDAAPDFSTALSLISQTRVGMVYGAYYVRKAKTAFANYDMKEVEQLVSADRVKTFDVAAKSVNNGHTRFARMKEMAVIMEHTSNLKRVSSVDSQGEKQSMWVSTGPDHYGHALNYLHISASLCDYRGNKPVVPTLPMASKTRVGVVPKEPELSLTDK